MTTQLKTLVVGASLNESRYSNKAIKMLRSYQHPVEAFGREKGIVNDVYIGQEFPETGIHTVTLYLNPAAQKEYYQPILKLKPRRIIFNPGTENPELQKLAAENGIETENACTLVMLSTGQY